MLVTTIINYLESHKRLVVPQLGAFIVKEPGQVLFTELLKRDDGVLRNLLREERINELEAAGEIDRFVFEIRHAVEHGREYPIEGFGTMKPGPNQTIVFVHAPTRQHAAEPASGTAGPHPAPTGSTQQPGDASPRVSPSVKLNPEPCLKGLRYGKPPKNTNAYTFVGHAPRKRTDRFVWIAIIAAVIALSAIAFGYFRETREKRQEATSVELTAPQTAAGTISEQTLSAPQASSAATSEALPTVQND